MDPPPPSQSQTVPKTTLFSNPDGTPIRVFIQADLFGRAKVVKNLRLNGAELLSDASNSQIMLVDPVSRQGRQFIRDWGKDNNKAVLDFVWVEKCLKAERPLLAEVRWGDCLALDDGRPIDSGGELDGAMPEACQNPLPTPRVTPEERARLLSRTSNARQPSVRAKSQAGDVPMEALSPPPTASNSSASILPDTMPSQPLSPTDIPPMSGMNPFMLMQNPAAMNMQNIPPSMFAATAQAAQAMMANMLMNMNPNMIPNQQPYPNDAFMLALQDSMRNHAVASWPGVQPQNGMFHASQPTSPLLEPPVPYPSAPSSYKTREPFRSASPTLRPSGSRRVSSVSEFESSQNARSKGRASSPAAKRRKVSSTSTKDIEMGDTKASAQTGHSLHEELFKTESGRQLNFFVQIEIHNRFKLVSSIKKSGGAIVETPSMADYAVLYAGNQRQKVFKTLLQAAHTANVPAVQSKFVHDCLSRGRMLDPENYLYEPELKRKRRRSVSVKSVESESEDCASEIDEAERKRLAKNAREAQRRIRIKTASEQEGNHNSSPYLGGVKTPKPTPKRAKSVEANYPRATDGPLTPSPPPESSRETCPQGYKFSREENEFALQFAKILIDRDYKISQTAVVNAIYKKLPHHTLRSWRGHFSAIAGEWDTWRKRSAIAHRKAQIRRESGGEPSVSAATMGNFDMAEGPVAIRNGNKAQPLEQDLEDDMKTVVRFFVDGNDRDQTEDETVVWKRLAEKIPCKTEGSWETFYEKHAEDVIERYNTALD